MFLLHFRFKCKEKLGDVMDAAELWVMSKTKEG